MGWLLDELFDAALSGWRRERLGEFCERVGAALLAE
jgi:hypothetical protein